jgi:hypothetical protein
MPRKAAPSSARGQAVGDRQVILRVLELIDEAVCLNVAIYFNEQDVTKLSQGGRQGGNELRTKPFCFNMLMAFAVTA